MPTFYADSSALVKRYLTERGLAWFRQLTAPSASNRVQTARLSLVEVVSALNRRVRGGEPLLDEAALAGKTADRRGRK